MTPRSSERRTFFSRSPSSPRKRPLRGRILRDATFLAVGFAAHFSLFVEGMEDRLRDNASLLTARPWPDPELSPTPQAETYSGACSFVDDTAIDVKAFDAVAQHSEVRAQHGRVVPFHENGEMKGYKLIDARHGSLAQSLGFRNGDLIVRVDEFELDSAEAGVAAYWRMLRELSFDVAFVRDGQHRVNRIKLLLPRPPRGPIASPERLYSPMPGRYVVDRKFVKKVVSDPALLARQARLVPVEKDEEWEGLELKRIRRGSIPKLLGLKNGDVLASVNALPLADYSTSMFVFRALRRAGQLDVVYTRKGERRVLHVEIR